jgi:nitroreductase
MNFSKEDILKAFNFRHACKEFDSSKKVSDEDFNFILETGRLSPSSLGFEPWKFIIVQNQELREKIRSVCWGGQRQLPTASHFVIILARNSNDLMYDSEYITKLMKEVKKMPDEIITAIKDKYKDFLENDFKLLDNDRSLFDWSCKQTYIALGNMMTSAALIGIDSCPIEGFHRESLESLLEKEHVLDKNKFGVSCMVAFGYRKDEPRPKNRQSMDSIAEWI